MDPEASSALPSVRRLLFAVIGVAFAWVLLTLLSGLGSSDARADLTDEGGALAGLVTSVVDDTTSVVTDAATTAVGTVDALTTAVAPAPAPAPPTVVAPVVRTAEPVVNATVRAAVAPGVLTPLVGPVVQLVAAVPVAGAITSDLGVDEALPVAAEAVDGTLVTLTSGLTGVVGGVIQPVESALPGLPIVPAPASTSGTSADAATLSNARGDGLLARMAAVARTLVAGAVAMNVRSPAEALVAPTAGGYQAPSGPSMPSDAVSMGPLGAGPGVWGALALVTLVAHRAWVRRSVREDDDAPAAPVLGTDVSPD